MTWGWLHYIKKGNLQLGASEAGTSLSSCMGTSAGSPWEECSVHHRRYPVWSPRTSWGFYNTQREQTNGSMYWTPAGLWVLLQTCHQLQQSLHSEASTLVLYSRMLVINQNKQKPQTRSPCSSQSTYGHHRKPRHGGSSSLTTWQDLVSQQHGWVCQ